MKSSHSDLFGIFMIIMVIVGVLTFISLIEYWRWQAYMAITHEHISFWIWMLVFHK